MVVLLSVAHARIRWQRLDWPIVTLCRNGPHIQNCMFVEGGRWSLTSLVLGSLPTNQGSFPQGDVVGIVLPGLSGNSTY